MTGGKAIDLMNDGKKVKLPEWEGYWFKKNGQIWVHLENGTDIPQSEMVWVNATIWRNDWEVKED